MYTVVQFLCVIGTKIYFILYFYFYPSLLLTWMFEHDCLDTYAVLGVLYACVLYFVFVLVQGNWACFTWKGALEMQSFLLLKSPYSYTLPILFCSILGCVFSVKEVALHQLSLSFAILDHTAPCCPTVLSVLMTFWSSNWSYTLYLPFCASNSPSIIFHAGNVSSPFPFCIGYILDTLPTFSVVCSWLTLKLPMLVWLHMDSVILWKW